MRGTAHAGAGGRLGLGSLMAGSVDDGQGGVPEGDDDPTIRVDPASGDTDATRLVERPARVRVPADAARTQRRPYVAAAARQEPYASGGDDRSNTPASRKASRSWRKWIVAIVAAVVVIIVVFQVVACATSGTRTVADAGSNAVGASSEAASSSSSAATTDETSSSDSSAHDVGSSVGASVGSAIGGLVGDTATKLGSVDTSGIADQLGSAADSLGDAASALGAAAGDLVGQLTDG